jgi:hypothetical protein
MSNVQAAEEDFTRAGEKNPQGYGVRRTLLGSGAIIKSSPRKGGKLGRIVKAA